MTIKNHWLVIIPARWFGSSGCSPVMISLLCAKTFAGGSCAGLNPVSNTTP
ncbi:MAG: hypothetical protein QF464_06495 [Myxococcota bacterium]|nr:hypothetical protein [Myxococcota bacterium]